MLENIKENIEKLISLYETERQKADELEARLSESEGALSQCKAQIAELTRQVDSLKLSNAFASGDGANVESRERLDKLIHEIDKCISLLEN